MENNQFDNYINYRLSLEKTNNDLVISSFNYIINRINNNDQLQLAMDRLELLEYIIGEVKSSPSSTYEEIASNAYESFLLNKDDEKPEISIYDTILTKFLNLVSLLKSINTPTSYYKPDVSLINDMFQTVFNNLYAFSILISSKLYTSALTSWRSLHESECIIKLLIENEKIKKEYIKHIKYNNYLRNQDAYTKEELDANFERIKKEMASHDLKSKDMKKFIEYGYLYYANNYSSSDTRFKLNFRDGLEYLANLDKYASVYEGASQIVHSSSSYFYANNSFCKKLSLTLTYQTLIRITNLYIIYMKDYFDKNKDKLKEVNRLLEKVIENSKKLDQEIDIEGIINE